MLRCSFAHRGPSLSKRRALVACIAFGLAAALVAGDAPNAARAADNPLGAIPESADMVLRFRKPKATIDAVNKFAAAVDQKIGQEVRKQLSGIGTMISNPQGTGADIEHDWYVAYFLNPKKETTKVFIIPTAAKKASDFETAVKQTMQKAKFRSHDKWTIYTDNDAAMSKFIETGGGKVPSIARKLDAESQALFDKADLALFINVRHLVEETYKIEIDAAKEELDAALKDIDSLIPKTSNSAFPLKPAFQIYAETERTLLQVALDVEHVTLSMRLTPTGVDTDNFIRVAAGSPTSELLASNEGAPMTVLERMPPNKPLYFASYGNHKGLARWRSKLGQATTSDASLASSLADAMNAYEQLEVGTQAFAFSLGDFKNGIVRTVSVSEMKPADQAKDVTRKLLTATSAVNLPQLHKQLELQEEAEEAAGQKVDVAKIVSLEGDADAGLKLFDDILGSGESSTTRIAYLADYVVETFGGGTAAMAEAITGLSGAAKKPGAASSTSSGSGGAKGGNLGITATRAKLAPTPNMVVLLDLPGLTADGLKAVSDIPLIGPLLGVSTDQLRKIPLRRSYAGFSVATESGGVRIKGNVPQTQFQGLAKLQPILAPLLKAVTGFGNSMGGPGAPGGAGAIPPM